MRNSYIFITSVYKCNFLFVFQTDRTRIVIVLDAALQSQSGKVALGPARMTAVSGTGIANVTSLSETDGHHRTSPYHSSVIGNQNPVSGVFRDASLYFFALTVSQSESETCGRCVKERGCCQRDCLHMIALSVIVPIGSESGTGTETGENESACCPLTSCH